MAENAVTVNVRGDDDRLHDAVEFLQRTESYHDLLSDIQNRGITQVEIAPESSVNHSWDLAPGYTGIENGIAIVLVDTERSFPSGNMRGYLSVEEIIAHELAHHALGHTTSQEIDGFFGSVRIAALEAATMIHVNRTLRKELNLPQRLSFEANPWEIIDRPTYLHENPRHERYLQPNLPRNQRSAPKAGPGVPLGGNPLDPIDDPSFAPPQSARDLEGYRFGDLNIDQFSPRAVEVLDAIQRNAGVAELQVISRTPGSISTDAVGELGPERAMNGETVQLSVANLPTERRLAVLDTAIKAGVTGIDADDGTLTLEFGPEAAQGERQPGPRRAVADQDSWVYESQAYRNYVAGANIFPENPAPRPAFEANDRVAQAFDDAQRATVLPSDSAAGSSSSVRPSTIANQRVSQAFSDARRASAPPISQPSRSTSLTNPFALTRPVESIRPPASFPPAPSRAPSRSTLADQYRQRALEMTGRSVGSQGVMRPTAADFEQVRRASAPARRPTDRVSDAFERLSRQPASRGPSGPFGPGVSTGVLGDPLGTMGGSFFSSPLMGPSIGPFRPAGATPAPRSRVVRASVAPVRTRPAKTPATQTATAPWERHSGVGGGWAYPGRDQPSTPNARSQGNSGGTGGSIFDSIFGNPTNPWESQSGVGGGRAYGGRDQPSTPNARSRSSRGGSSSR